MIPASSIFPAGQRWCILATIILVEVVVWVNSADSGIAKQPVFVLGASLSVALFLANGIMSKRLTLPRSRIDLLVALHIPLFVCSALYTYDVAYTWGALAFGVSCVVFYFAGSTLFPGQKEVDFLFNGLAILTLVLCLVGGLQFLFPDILPFTFNTGIDRRITSLLGNSSTFASYLVVVLPILLSQALQGSPRPVISALRWALPATVLLVLAGTETRSSFLGCAVSLGVSAILMARTRRSRFVIAAAGLVLSLVLVSLVVLRPDLSRKVSAMYGDLRSSSVARRMYFWTAGRDAMLALPLTGHGIGSFEREVFVYRSPDYWEAGSEDVVPHAHNEILEIATEYGCVGLILLGVTFISVLNRGIRLARSPDTQCRLTGVGILGGLVAVAVDNLANESLRQAPVAMLVWLLMGLLSSRKLPAEEEKRITWTVSWPSLAACAPLLVWAVFALAYVWQQAHDIGADMHFQNGMNAAGRSPGEAISEFQAAVGENDVHLRARLYLAREYLNQGEWTNALTAVDELQRFSPHYPKSSLIKGYALFQLGTYREALESIRTELRERSHPEAYLMEAAACGAIGDTLAEREALRNLLRKDIAAKVPYQYRTACERLVQITDTGPERERDIALFDSLAAIVRTDAGFFEQLKRNRGAGR